MSLTTRIESLEDQFFPPTANTFTWEEVTFVYFLDLKYGSANVEKHISGIKLYKYKLLAARCHKILRKSQSGTSPVTTSKSTPLLRTSPRQKKAQKPPVSV